MTGSQGSGSTLRPSVERLCTITAVSRASYYRQWEASSPKQEETELRDLVQRLAMSQRFYGYRRITELVRREGWPVNRKRIARLLR